MPASGSSEALKVLSELPESCKEMLNFPIDKNYTKGSENDNFCQNNYQNN